MTDRSTLIDKLMDIQQVCNDARKLYPNASAHTLAGFILDIIKAN